MFLCSIVLMKNTDLWCLDLRPVTLPGGLTATSGGARGPPKCQKQCPDRILVFIIRDLDYKTGFKW